MTKAKLFENIKILYGSEHSAVEDSVLISNNELIAFGEQALMQSKELNVTPTKGDGKLLAPCLVDPYSVLEEPIKGHSESLASLRSVASSSGYGQIALLPRSPSWRDSPEKLHGFNNKENDVLIHLWGALSKGGEGTELTPHSALLKHGAIGLAEDDSIPTLNLLQKALSIGAMGSSPLLLAPRDTSIQGNGIVREGVETLRAGWHPDPETSETLPLGQILELQRNYPEKAIRIMNVSTSAGVSMLIATSLKPMASVCWWHLVSDRASLNLTDIGWRVSPSLGGPKDRESLVNATINGEITAIAVNSIPLDEEDSLIPLEQRIPGISGHQLVLPALWQELVVKGNCSIERLWEAISFGPSKFLGLPEERLTCGSRRWLLFDPNEVWNQNRMGKIAPKAANQPWENQQIKGKVIDCGLRG